MEGSERDIRPGRGWLEEQGLIDRPLFESCVTLGKLPHVSDRLDFCFVHV